MATASERGVEAHTPVPLLVAESLDHDRPVVRYRSRRGRLVVQVLEQVFDREVVEACPLSQPLGGGGWTHAAQLAHHLAQRSAELDRTARGVSFPERDLAGLARRR